MARQRSSCASGPWLRLAEWCTQARRPRPASAVLCFFPHLACVIWCPVCSWWCVGSATRHELGKGESCSDACLLETPWTSRSVRPYAQPPLTAQRTWNCVRQASIPTMVCGGGGGALVVAGEGAVKGLCARMQAHADVRQCAVLASRRGLTPLSPPPPPTPGVRLPVPAGGAKSPGSRISQSHKW